MSYKMSCTAYLELMSNLGLQVEVVIDQLHLEGSIVGNEGVVSGHAVVQVGNALLQILHLPLHHIMPKGSQQPVTAWQSSMWCQVR